MRAALISPACCCGALQVLKGSGQPLPVDPALPDGLSPQQAAREAAAAAEAGASTAAWAPRGHDELDKPSSSAPKGATLPPVSTPGPAPLRQLLFL